MATKKTEATAETAEQTEPGAIDIFVSGRKVQVSNGGMFRLQSWPVFGPGDTVSVHYRIKEGDKERVQLYEGIVTGFHGESNNRTFTVRRIAHDVGVERTFPYHSPWIAKVVVKRRGKVRRAKLFYLRNLSGKAGRIKEAFRK